MGKYDKEEREKDVDKNIQRDLFWIASELAEANRLKRMELSKSFVKIRCDIKDGKSTFDKKDLEDQA